MRQSVFSGKNRLQGLFLQAVRDRAFLRICGHFGYSLGAERDPGHGGVFGEFCWCALLSPSVHVRRQSFRMRVRSPIHGSGDRTPPQRASDG